MSQPTDDPLIRALNTLQYLHAPKTDPVSVAFWEEVRDAILEAQRERAAFVAVVRTGRALIDALDRYEAAPVGDVEQVVELAAEIDAAEDAFVEALNRFPANLGAEAQPWSEEALLASLDHLNDDEANDDDDDEETRH